ncbi:MAG: hypothetical protein ACRCX2_13240 [Paraclostridium sp.]
MKEIKLPITRYNPDEPSDLTVIKDIPKSIRNKASELINILLTLEESKVSTSIKETISAFPFVKNLFVQGNGLIPDAMYCKKDNVWVGYGNYNYLPTVNEHSKNGERITIHGKTFELVIDEELKIWVEKPEVTPELFYDFFETSATSTPVTLQNCGIGSSNIKMTVSNYKRDSRYFVPYIASTASSRCETNAPLLIKDRLTFTTVFNTISREYQDETETVIDPNHNSVLMYIRDEFENVKVGLCYNKDNMLYYFNKTLLTPINKSLPTDSATQLTMQLHENTVKVFMNNTLVFSTEDGTIKDKKILFSICSDMYYGQYANGAATFGDPIVFLDVLSDKELRMLFDKPRSFYYNSQYQTYLDLNVNDKVNLKSFLEEKRLDFQNKNLKKEFYLEELRLVSLYETEVIYGLADPSYRENLKIYLEELKLGISRTIERPVILSEYK